MHHLCRGFDVFKVDQDQGTDIATVAGFVLKRPCVLGQCSGAVPLSDVLIRGVEGLPILSFNIFCT